MNTQTLSAGVAPAAPPAAPTVDIKRLLLGFKREAFWVAVFGLFSNLLTLAPTLYMMQVFDRVMASGSEYTLAALSLITVAFFLVMGFADWARSRLLVRAGARFDLMAQLERVPGGLKMGELSKRMMVTGGNVTGITDQLVAEGLVVREDNPQDRRAHIVKLTPEGRKVFRKMAEAHEKWIVELFGGMGEKDRVQLHALLAQLKTHAAKVVGR